MLNGGQEESSLWQLTNLVSSESLFLAASLALISTCFSDLQSLNHLAKTCINLSVESLQAKRLWGKSLIRSPWGGSKGYLLTGSQTYRPAENGQQGHWLDNFILNEKDKSGRWVPPRPRALESTQFHSCSVQGAGHNHDTHPYLMPSWIL